MVDHRTSVDDINVEVQYSFTVKKSVIYEAVSILDNYERANPTGWNRSVDSMLLEWDVHNMGVALGNIVCLYPLFDASKHVAFDNKSEGWGYIQHFWDGARKIISRIF